MWLSGYPPGGPQDRLKPEPQPDVRGHCIWERTHSLDPKWDYLSLLPTALPQLTPLDYIGPIAFRGLITAECKQTDNANPKTDPRNGTGRPLRAQPRCSSPYYTMIFLNSKLIICLLPKSLCRKHLQRKKPKYSRMSIRPYEMVPTPIDCLISGKIYKTQLLDQFRVARYMRMSASVNTTVHLVLCVDKSVDREKLSNKSI